MPRISIIIPTYNEKENLQILIPKITNVFKQNNYDGRVIIVDDASPDGTGDAARRLGKENNVVVISRPCKSGLGSAYILGFKQALLDSDIIFEMDADNSHDPKDIPSLVEGLKTSDVAIGSRYVPGGAITGWGVYRKMVSKSGNLTAKIFLGMKTNDITTGYRAYKKEALESIDFSEIKSNGYAFQVEILYMASRKGFDILEVPITFRNREIGESKLSRKEIFWFFMTCLRLRMMSLKNPR